MSHYWARFRTIGGSRFRFDTRIYLQANPGPQPGDHALGCIIGKNPGSAIPSKRSVELMPMALSGDKFLPTVLSVLRQSYAKAGKAVPPGGYIQVLNLFYLCDRDLSQAKRSLSTVRRAPPCCPEEHRDFPWAWFAWGGPDRVLDPLKIRFSNLESPMCFYYSKDHARVVSKRPGAKDLAKHTQGMPQAKVVAHLAKLIGR